MANLKTYMDKILSEQDKTLFHEAVVSASKAPRGAYILIWISCAESLKRKFKEAALRDGQANRVVGLIQATEENHQSADMLILKQAKDYGFIDDAAYQKLEHVYELRCLYGHPYESAPSDVELLAAADIVINEVLSKPAYLKHGFIQRLVEQMFNDTNYLEHSEESVREFSREISGRIDLSVYSYLIDKYAEKIENAYSDPLLRVVVNRGLWFLSEFLLVNGTDFFSAAQWHDFVAKFPNTAQNIILRKMEAFDSVGIRARNYIVSYVISESTRKPTLLKKLEKLYLTNRLSQTQLERIMQVDIKVMHNSNLDILCCFNAVITALKSHNWYKQNPAAQIIKNSKSSLSALEVAQLEELGRNILQASEGGSGESCELLSEISKNPEEYPDVLICGIVLETFLNENNEFRLKVANITEVIELMKARPGFVTKLLQDIPNSSPKPWVTSAQMTSLLTSLQGEQELREFKELLEHEKSRLVTFAEEEIFSN